MLLFLTTYLCRGHFLTTYPPHLVYAVIERPLSNVAMHIYWHTRILKLELWKDIFQFFLPNWQCPVINAKYVECNLWMFTLGPSIYYVVSKLAFFDPSHLLSFFLSSRAYLVNILWSSPSKPCALFTETT